MQTAIVCRNCGHADLLEVAPEQQDLLTVGMFERPCQACNRGTRWGRGIEMRRHERRLQERRDLHRAGPLAPDQRALERRADRRRHSGVG